MRRRGSSGSTNRPAAPRPMTSHGVATINVILSQGASGHLRREKHDDVVRVHRARHVDRTQAAGVAGV
jgi:hypothetical protein